MAVRQAPVKPHRGGSDGLGHRPEHRFGFGVGQDEVGGLGDFSVGVGDHDPGLLLDGGAPLGVVSGDGGAGAEQPEQRVGEGRLAGPVAADQPRTSPRGSRRTAGRRPDDNALAVAGDMGAQRPPGESAEDHQQVGMPRRADRTDGGRDEASTLGR